MAYTEGNFTSFTPNPGDGYIDETFSTVATGEKTTYFVPTTSKDVGVQLTAPSTAKATLEVSESPIAAIRAGTGIWTAASTALTDVTAGAIVYAIVQGPVQAIRVNVGTALAANTGRFCAQVRNNLY